MSRARPALVAVIVLSLVAPGAWADFTPWSDVKAAGARAVDRESRWRLALGGAAVLGARSVDGSARTYMDGTRRLGDLDPVGNDVLGTGVPGVLLGAGFWGYGLLRDEAGPTRSGQSQLEALAATGLATLLLKASVDRTRPDDSDRNSFPSGHASTTFATATVLAELYGWRAGVPAYALATLTGASRMSTDRHWLSDVVAGAALGIWLGRAFAASGPSESAGLGNGWWIEPVADGGGTGEGALVRAAFAFD